MFQNTQDFFVAAKPYLEQFAMWIKKYQPQGIADHICYKCGSREEFEHLRHLFESESSFMYQSMIGGRYIAVIKWLTPLASPIGNICYLELSDQKPDGSQVSGFDHIEIYPRVGSMEDLAATIEGQGVICEKVIRPHHTTFDAIIFDTFKVRLEPEALIEKIIRDEIRNLA